MKKLPKLRTYQQLKFVLEREEYLETIMDNEQRRRVTALRGGTNSLRIEVGRWKGVKTEHVLCVRKGRYKNIQIATAYDLNSMRGDQEWLLHTL